MVSTINPLLSLGRGGGQSVSKRTFYSDYPSLNAADIKKSIRYKTHKEAGVGPLKYKQYSLQFLVYLDTLFSKISNILRFGIGHNEKEQISLRQ